MYMIAGLGNFGKKYDRTRHNAGFLFVDRISEFIGRSGYLDVDAWKQSDDGEYFERRARDGQDMRVLFIKPTTYMNASGRAVRSAVGRWKDVADEDLVIAHDDLDIPLGTFKIQNGVGPKVHHGVKSVEQALGKVDFVRIRIGVDSRHGDRQVSGEDYVLQKMDEAEYTVLEESIADAIKQVRSLLEV